MRPARTKVLVCTRAYANHLQMRWLLSILVLIFGGWAVSRLWRGRFSFQGRVALITGGSRGLGLVLARQICDEGGRVAILARDEDELDLIQKMKSTMTFRQIIRDRH